MQTGENIINFSNGRSDNFIVERKYWSNELIWVESFWRNSEHLRFRIREDSQERNWKRRNESTNGIENTFFWGYNLLLEEVKELSEKLGVQNHKHPSLLRKRWQLIAVLTSSKYFTSKKLKKHFT